ncbi:ABC transporter permease [Amycolatopsis ultiminotia]|uniref:ABC transporter permease n=1 Tax=Amycolatopsis ultiminotia TaxID=543629 RepID=A0ABP6YLT5_9PSEU
MSGIRAVRLLTTRELSTRFRARSFVVSTVVLLLLVLGYVLVQALLTDSGNRVALTGQAQGIGPRLQATGERIELVPVPSEQDGLERVRDGGVDALVSGSVSRLRITVKSTVDPELGTVLDGIVREQVLDAELSAAQLDPASIRQTVAAAHAEVRALEPPAPDPVPAVVVAVLLGLSLLGYGVLVAYEIADDKAARATEVLLTVVRPGHLLCAKVFGAGLAGLVHFVVLAVAGIAAAVVSGVLPGSASTPSILIWGVVWYLLGFPLYALLYAAAGALVSRREDTPSTAWPVCAVQTICFAAGLVLLAGAPDGDAIRVASLIPLLSPILMPARAATAAPWEVVTALLLTIAALGVTAWLGNRIHRNAVRRPGHRVRLGNAVRD